MAEEISNPLLSLIKEQGLIDDLQYEEVAARVQAQRHAGHPDPAGLRDHGLDAILQVMADLSGHGGRFAARPRFAAGAAASSFRPMSRGCINACRCSWSDGTLAGRPGRPARPGARGRTRLRRSRRTSRWWWPTRRRSKRRSSKHYGQEDTERRLRTSSRNWARTRKSPAKSARRRPRMTRR